MTRCHNYLYISSGVVLIIPAAPGKYCSRDHLHVQVHTPEDLARSRPSKILRAKLRAWIDAKKIVQLWSLSEDMVRQPKAYHGTCCILPSSNSHCVPPTYWSSTMSCTTTSAPAIGSLPRSLKRVKAVLRKPGATE